MLHVKKKIAGIYVIYTLDEDLALALLDERPDVVEREVCFQNRRVSRMCHIFNPKCCRSSLDIGLYFFSGR